MPTNAAVAQINRRITDFGRHWQEAPRKALEASVATLEIGISPSIYGGCPSNQQRIKRPRPKKEQLERRKEERACRT